jgi:large subunit ribosomal protein L18
MKGTVTYRVKRRRRRVGRTDYAKRLRSLRSGKDRFVVRISNNKVVAQVIRYKPEGDVTLVNATSLELKKFGWTGAGGNVCAAYLTGVLCGAKAVKKGLKDAVFDLGLHTPVNGSNVFAALRGATEAGMAIPHDKAILPSDERISGKTIQEYSKKAFAVPEVKGKIMATASFDKKK